jgi:hypothetical protein
MKFLREGAGNIKIINVARNFDGKVFNKTQEYRKVEQYGNGVL